MHELFIYLLRKAKFGKYVNSLIPEPHPAIWFEMEKFKIFCNATNSFKIMLPAKGTVFGSKVDTFIPSKETGIAKLSPVHIVSKNHDGADLIENKAYFLKTIAKKDDLIDMRKVDYIDSKKKFIRGFTELMISPEIKAAVLLRDSKEFAYDTALGEAASCVENYPSAYFESKKFFEEFLIYQKFFGNEDLESFIKKFSSISSEEVGDFFSKIDMILEDITENYNDNDCFEIFEKKFSEVWGDKFNKEVLEDGFLALRDIL